MGECGEGGGADQGGRSKDMRMQRPHRVRVREAGHLTQGDLGAVDPQGMDRQPSPLARRRRQRNKHTDKGRGGGDDTDVDDDKEVTPSPPVEHCVDLIDKKS